jgi:hypothetical protein
MSGFRMLTTPIDTLNEVVPGLNMPYAGKMFLDWFGLALIALGLVSLFAALMRDRFALGSISLAFLIFNASAAYYCFQPSIETDLLFVSAVVHSVAAVLFSVVIVATYRRSS